VPINFKFSVSVYNTMSFWKACFQIFYLDTSMLERFLTAAGVVPGVPQVGTSAGYLAGQAQGQRRSNCWTDTDSHMFVMFCHEIYGRFPSVRDLPSRSGIHSGPRSFLGADALCSTRFACLCRPR